jgi:phosphoribosylamine--glycine ligase
MYMGNVDKYELKVSEQTAVTVMCVSAGYPESYNKGFKIEGLESACAEGSVLFHAGTAQKGDDVVTSGGRVICATSLAPTMREALDKSYETVGRLSYEGIYYRRDIGLDLEKYL